MDVVVMLAVPASVTCNLSCQAVFLEFLQFPAYYNHYYWFFVSKQQSALIRFFSEFCTISSQTKEAFHTECISLHELLRYVNLSISLFTILFHFPFDYNP